MDNKNMLNDNMLQEVAGGVNNYGAKYPIGKILYDRGNDKIRFEIRDITFDETNGLLYHGCIQIYSIQQPGTATMPLPLLPPSQLYQWRDHSSVSYSEAGLEENWEAHN